MGVKVLDVVAVSDLDEEGVIAGDWVYLYVDINFDESPVLLV